VRVGEHYLQSLRGVFHFVHVSANALVHTETLAWDHVFAQHGAFGFQVKPDGRLHAVDCLQDPTDDFTNLAAKELKLLALFRVADFLLNGLARSTCGNTTKVSRRGFHHYEIANLRVRINHARFIQEHFSTRINNRV